LTRKSNRVELVAIGASLGGLLQLERLLSRLPAEFPAAIAMCQHRHDDTDSGLVRLLQKHSKLPVSEPEPLEPILPGRAYLAPAGYHLLVDERAFNLSVDPPVSFARPSVDVLFESVADAYGRNSAGVILTSSSADGANGAKAIKRAGGKIAVQDPKTAESPIASRAALEMTTADFVGDTELIADLLIRWCT
jgi:two-component system, chemotaxis family, protein-glutamate methylesterase/glutaminase